MLTASLVLALLQAPSSDSLPIIRPADDGFRFIESETSARFVPFGSNLVMQTESPDDRWGLGLLTPKGWDQPAIERFLDAQAALGMNYAKVFLPIGDILPDPQPDDGARLAEGTLDRVRTLLDLSEKRGIRISLTLSEWGGNDCKWWQDGGQYWGVGDEGRTNRRTLADFWRRIAEVCRGRGALLSYNLAAEWTMPNYNLTWRKDWDGLIPGPYALPRFRAFLGRVYDDVDGLNAAWGTHHDSFDDVEQPDLRWDGANYASPDPVVRDWNEFREWTSLEYLRFQADGIRAVDPDHMITAGTHGRTPADQWPGSAQYVMGCTARDTAAFLDYVTVHHYVYAADVEKGLKLGVLLARFAWAGKPVVMEEFGYIPGNTAERRETLAEAERNTADVVVQVMKRTAGCVSGWSLWYFTNTTGNTALDVTGEVEAGPYTPDLKPTAVAEALSELRASGFFDSLPGRRAPAATVVPIRRGPCMSPREFGPLQALAERPAGEQDVDFTWPPPPLLRAAR